MKHWNLLPLVALVAACASSTAARTSTTATPQPPTPSQPPSQSQPAAQPALATHLDAYLAAVRSGSTAGLAGLELAAPEAFFTRAFGAERGARLAADYGELRPSLSPDGFVRELGPPVRARNLSVVRVDPVLRSTSEPNLWTNAIVDALVSPVELFRVRLLPAGATDPNTPGFFDLGFFALDGGRWCAVGDLRALRR